MEAPGLHAAVACAWHDERQDQDRAENLRLDPPDSPRCRYTRVINPEEMVKAALAALVQEREVYCTQFRGADYFYCNY